MRRLLLLLALAGCAGSHEGSTLPRAETGGYAEGLLPGEKPPSNAQGQPVQPKVTAAFDEVPTSNKWWSSLIWQYQDSPYSQPLWADPLVFQARAGGLGIGVAGAPTITPRAFLHPFRQDLLAGVDGLEASSTRVASYGDWTVTARWEAGARTLEATIGHGLPYAYFRTAGGPAVVESQGAIVIAETGNALALDVDGRVYGLFSTSPWRREGKRFRSEASSFSIAALPDDRPATFARFRQHAGAVVTGSKVSWAYDAATAELRTTFTFETRGGTPLVALYPHQWKNLGRDLGPPSYRSPRGAMKLLEGDRFETRLTFGGVLPILARPAGDLGPLPSQLRAAARGELFPAGLENTRGTYWTGKGLLRASLLAWMADQLGETEVRGRLVKALEEKLEDWFDGRPPNLFGYDRTWATLIGMPSEYRSGWEMNDHHFHYGQFIHAAATVARFDPAWAARWGTMVEDLIKDCASTDRGDRRFPFLRYFDAYAGHSWANGPSLFVEGNNEESSSEDANFATAVILWGSVTGQAALRDLGVFLHATLTTAVEQYWFDVDGDNFPPGFGKTAVAMVWGAGGKYDTWWDHNPIYVHGINFLPFTGGSLYLGRRPDYVRRNHAAIIAANHGQPLVWRDIVWMYQALAEPERALALVEESPHFEPEFGDSRAFVQHWVRSLASHGQVDTTVTADLPTYAVLRKGAVRNHVAFNPAAHPAEVRFSDGTVMKLGPFEEAVASGPIAAPTAAR